HQEAGARVARKGDWILRVLAVLDVGYRADFFDRVAVAGDDETAALEGKLALGLRNDLIEGCFADGDGVHRISPDVDFWHAETQAPACGKLNRLAAPPQRRHLRAPATISIDLPVARPRYRK